MLLRGDGDGDVLMLFACCKHLTAYDLKKWGNFSRYSFDVVVSNQDIEDTYQPPFRSCVQQGKASCLMCSYNRVNGVPACARPDLFQKAKTEWGFKGYVNSDCDVVATVYEYQHYVNSPEDAVADVLKAGTDINCGSYMLRHAQSAIDQGKVKEEDIDRVLVNDCEVEEFDPSFEVRAVIEGQILSMRGHAERFGMPSPPKRIIATGEALEDIGH